MDFANKNSTTFKDRLDKNYVELISWTILSEILILIYILLMDDELAFQNLQNGKHTTLNSHRKHEERTWWTSIRIFKRKIRFSNIWCTNP